ncbi:hypothetical protein [Maritimibacter alkaliphilus]|nr:hypothetical protein [Maritimibacter alkaliphilus]MBY6088889.1 hypothetical protein [Maritimibacter alkaliphilus]
MLFRPVRFLILLALAFVAGVIWEKHQQAERCLRVTGALHDILCQVP